jgi:hypothetical protein
MSVPPAVAGGSTNITRPLSQAVLTDLIHVHPRKIRGLYCCRCATSFFHLSRKMVTSPPIQIPNQVQGSL